jgi:hypothetical protein
VEREAELMQIAGDGKPVIEHLRIAERQAGRAVAEMTLPEVPSAAIYLLRAFGDLNARRGSTGYGPCRLTVESIKAWADLNGIAFTAWESETLCKMDDALMAKVVAARAQGG